MIYKNQKLLSLACSKDLKTRKKVPKVKYTGPTIHSILASQQARLQASAGAAANSSQAAGISRNNLNESPVARHDAAEVHPIATNRLSSHHILAVLLLLLLLLTSPDNLNYFRTPGTSDHFRSNLALNHHVIYQYFHRTRHKPQGQQTSPQTPQLTDRPTIAQSTLFTGWTLPSG
jgi:hypothetical protein